MKLKIVVKVPIYCEKQKSKAMQIAVAVQGVSSVGVGKENDTLEVIGEGVDSVCLAVSLRKKFSFAEIVTVEEVKPPDSTDQPSPPPSPPPCWSENCPPSWQPYYYECRVYDTAPPDNCHVM